jgi:hypothetical protein
MIRDMRTRSTVSDLLVRAYKLRAAGDEGKARRVVLGAWMMGMDTFSSPQDARVAVKLLRRLGFATDAADEWAVLPDPLPVYRAGGPGLAWTADREVAESLVEQFSLEPVRSRSVAKADVLAYIAGYGEAEVIINPDSLESGR